MEIANEFPLHKYLQVEIVFEQELILADRYLKSQSILANFKQTRRYQMSNGAHTKCKLIPSIIYIENSI